MRSVFVYAATAALSFVLAGCVAPIRVLPLNMPSSQPVPEHAKPVVISSVVDARDFSTNPDAEGERLNKDAVARMGEGNKQRAIADVKSNAAWLLPQGETVADKVRVLVTQTLAKQGYKTVPADDAPADAPRISVRITEFWATQPFSLSRAIIWAPQMKAWIQTDLSIKNGSSEKTFAVTGHGTNVAQTIRDVNWQETYSEAMENYQKDLDGKLRIAL